jgi:hypothetical protein
MDEPWHLAKVKVAGFEPVFRSQSHRTSREKARRRTRSGTKPPRSPRPTGTDRPGRATGAHADRAACRQPQRRWATPHPRSGARRTRRRGAGLGGRGQKDESRPYSHHGGRTNSGATASQAVAGRPNAAATPASSANVSASPVSPVHAAVNHSWPSPRSSIRNSCTCDHAHVGLPRPATLGNFSERRDLRRRQITIRDSRWFGSDTSKRLGERRS